MSGAMRNVYQCECIEPAWDLIWARTEWVERCKRCGDERIPTDLSPEFHAVLGGVR